MNPDRKAFIISVSANLFVVAAIAVFWFVRRQLSKENKNVTN